MNLETYLAMLNSNTEASIALANSCSEKELNHKTIGKWSILEQLEHICLTEKVIHMVITRPSEKKNSSAELLGNTKIQSIMLELRNEKISAPESLHPKGKIKNYQDFEKLFLEQRLRFKSELLSSVIIVDQRVHKHPVLGEMTISDWLYFMLHHTQRHLEQIEELLKVLRTSE